MTILFFNISGGEFLIIAAFVLIFFGSKGLPEFARTFGRTIRQLRDASDQVKRDIESSARDVQHDIKKNMESVARGAKVNDPLNQKDEKSNEDPEENRG